MAKNTYTDKDIIHLKGLQAVRKRPGVYVGDITSPTGVFQLIKEGVDNAIDEALAGYCKHIKVNMNLVTREVIVSDDGRGIPQKSLPIVFGKLHSGSKFSDKVYSVSGGTHGVGVSSTNALSAVFECFSIREGKSVWVKYKKGELIKGPLKKKPEKLIRINGKHGTTIRFIPDFSLVTYKKLPYKMVLRWLEAIPLLCPGLKIEVSIASKTKTAEKTFFSKAGLKGQKKGKDALYAKRDNLELCINLLSEETKLLGYVNTISVREGSHIKAFWRALKASLNSYSKKKSPKQAALKEGISGIFHVLAKDPIYIGQTKEILGDTRIEKQVYTALKEVFDEYFSRNSSVAHKIVKRALAIEALYKEHKSKLSSLKGIDKDIKRGRLPTALAVSSTKHKEERELFLVEGESAGGTGKSARDRRYQEILPVKGKILNVARNLNKPDKILKSEEIQNVIKAIGGLDPNKGRVGKVILLSDSDVDGFHITALSSTLFVFMLPKWIQEGRVYTVVGPLFHTIYKGKRYFGDTALEVQEQVKGKVNIMRVKGWGEMKPEDLRYVALDPSTRVLKRLEYTKKSSSKTMGLMGSNTGIRKGLLGLD
jgi:DNA gyrase subunit B